MSGLIILVSYLPDAPKFTRKWVNEEYCNFFDVCPEDVIGVSCLESTPEDRRSDVRKKIQYCIRTNGVLVSVETNQKADGRFVLIRWADVPVTDNFGKIMELLAIGTPMQDRRRNVG
jgi:PAS domain S-box-containing protein